MGTTISQTFYYIIRSNPQTINKTTSVQATSPNDIVLPGYKSLRCEEKLLQVIPHCNCIMGCTCAGESPMISQVGVSCHKPPQSPGMSSPDAAVPSVKLDVAARWRHCSICVCMRVLKGNTSLFFYTSNGRVQTDVKGA